MPHDIPPFATRLAREDEIDALYALHRETMRGDVEQTYGPWDEAYQSAAFREKFPLGRLEVIEVGDEVIGYIDAERLDDAWWLWNIRVAPGWQRHGIGAALVERVIAHARADGLPVKLQVLRVNPARALYERLGFTVFEELPTHYRMTTRAH